MLTREEVRRAIRFGSPPRPPKAFTKWWGEGLWEQYGEALHRFDKYEEDVVVVPFPCPAFDSPEGGFLYAAGNGIVGGTPIENIEAFLNECDR